MRFIQRKGAEEKALGRLEPWFSALLRARGIDTEEKAEAFLNPGPEDFHDPFLLEGMAETVRLLKEAAGRGDPILIWGDYDADGVCAASLLLQTLRETGAKAGVFLPSRHRDGYGLNRDRIFGSVNLVFLYQLFVPIANDDSDQIVSVFYVIQNRQIKIRETNFYIFGCDFLYAGCLQRFDLLFKCLYCIFR